MKIAILVIRILPLTVKKLTTSICIVTYKLERMYILLHLSALNLKKFPN